MACVVALTLWGQVSVAAPADSVSMSQADSTAAAAATPPKPAESPGLYARAKRGTVNFLSDTWWVFSSPARLNRRSALAAGTTGPVAFSYAASSIR